MKYWFVFEFSGVWKDYLDRYSSNFTFFGSVSEVFSYAEKKLISEIKRVNISHISMLALGLDGKRHPKTAQLIEDYLYGLSSLENTVTINGIPLTVEMLEKYNPEGN